MPPSLRKITSLNRWELINSKPWATGQQVRFTRDGDFDNSRWLRAVLINVQGTATVSGGPATGLLSDGVAAIVEEIIMKGKNRLRGSSDNFIDVRGSDLYEIDNQFAGTSVFDNSTALAVGNGAYNLDFNLMLEFAPPKMRVEEKIGYLLDVPNWSNLELDLNFGDEKSIWNLGGAAVAWSAQTVNLLGMYAQETNKFAGYSVGLRYLQFIENATSVLTTTANAQQLQLLDNKGKISRLFLKTGVKATTTTAGKNAFASLSDGILTSVKVVNFPTQIFRNFNRYTDIKAGDSYAYRRAPKQGYATIEFSGDELPYGSLSPKEIATGEANTTQLWLTGNVNGAANQALVTVQESLYYSDRIQIPRI